MQHRPTDELLASAIGRELRRRRRAAQLTQGEVGAPFTRAFVCAVERGRAMPSITALSIFVRRLDVDLDEFFRGVQADMTIRYTPVHGDRHQKTSSGGRR
jgi:transcriptional regulator with XRE-family HTH domain